MTRLVATGTDVVTWRLSAPGEIWPAGSLSQVSPARRGSPAGIAGLGSALTTTSGRVPATVTQCACPPAPRVLGIGNVKAATRFSTVSRLSTGAGAAGPGAGDVPPGPNTRLGGWARGGLTLASPAAARPAGLRPKPC